MTAMMKILVPIDFEEASDIALTYGRNLAKAFGAELHVLHVMENQFLRLTFKSAAAVEAGIANRVAERLTPEDRTSLRAVTALRMSDVPSDEIIQYAKLEGIDLIVMGTKGGGSLETKLIGSNTVRVIEKAEIPVLAIPEQSTFRAFKKIAYATDYRDPDTESISRLSEFASLFNAEIIVVHVAEFLMPANYENALFDVFIEEVRKTVLYKNISFHILKGLSKSKTFNEFTHENNIDLIAVSTRKKNIFTKMFDSGFTKKVAYHTEVPLLSFHTK